MSPKWLAIHQQTADNPFNSKNMALPSDTENKGGKR
jgi:hypothetical protein